MKSLTEELLFNTKFTQSIENTIDGERAIMFINDYIGRTMDKNGNYIGIDADYFVEEMYWHKRNMRKIVVKINSPGGQVFAGFSMIDAIIECEADTHIVGMAASMAGIISQFGVVRMCNDFALFMAHPPSGGKSQSEMKVTELLRERLGDCLKKKTKLTSAEVEKMMNGTEDVWLDSSEMSNKGIVDKVIVTGVKVDKNIKNNYLDNPKESLKIYEDLINSLEKGGTNNKVKPKTRTMEDSLKTLGAALKIENADESKVIAAFQENLTKVTKAEARVVELEAEVKTLKTANETSAKANATKLVENAIKAGKIDEKAKQSWIDMAVLNFDAVEKSIDGMKGTFTSVAAAIEAKKDEKAENTATDEKNTYKWLMVNDPKKLVEMAEKEPAKLEALEKEYQNSFKTK